MLGYFDPQFVQQGSTTRDAQPSAPVSVAAPFFGNGEKSFGEAGQGDLDAALQLLVNRAQYITGAGGAAIALRRGGTNDMLCRASIGANAPELGSLLSTEFGLSGESVRKKQALRCDDTGQDARVNREICRQLGISSVIVMPVLDEDQVLGVFELFSENANAFSDRDITVLQRLSQMVETAIRLAEAQASAVPKKAKAAAVGAGDGAVRAAEAANAATRNGEPSNTSLDAVNAVPVIRPPKKPLLWSASIDTEQESASITGADQSLIPPVLRGLRKCVACGFPVSAGRMLCVECEEKKWRGQLRSQANRSPLSTAPVAAAKSTGAVVVPATAKAAVAAETKEALASSAISAAPSISIMRDEASTSPERVTPTETMQQLALQSSESASTAAGPEFTLSSGIGPSQSWLAANKYVLIVLLAIAMAGVAIFFLR